MNSVVAGIGVTGGCIVVVVRRVVDIVCVDIAGAAGFDCCCGVWCCWC